MEAFESFISLQLENDVSRFENLKAQVFDKFDLYSGKYGFYIWDSFFFIYLMIDCLIVCFL